MKKLNEADLCSVEGIKAPAGIFIYFKEFYDSTYILKKEWSLTIESLGKIILISGPPSSGKSALTSKIVQAFQNCKTINRKEILYKVDNLPWVKESCTSLFGNGNISSDKNWLDVNQFRSMFFKEAFLLYYEEIKKHIFSGRYNVFLDESYVNSPESYNLFKCCFDHYPNIKSILIFSSMDELFTKCKTRNDKFLDLLRSNEELSIQDFITKQKDHEKESGCSSSTFRLPSTIIKGYKDYYNFQDYLSKDELCLGQIVRDSIRSTMCVIQKEQIGLLSVLLNRGFSVNEYDSPIDVGLEVAEIFWNSNKKYITSKINFDYVIPASKIASLSMLSNTEFLKHILKGISWLNIDDSIPYSTIPEGTLCKEWSVWSKCFGNVILMNGISCCGKTTLSTYVKKFGFSKISYDDICRKVALDHFETITSGKISKAQKYEIREEDIIKVVCNCYEINKDRYDSSQVEVIFELERSIWPIKQTTDMESYIKELLQDRHVYNTIYDHAKSLIFCGHNVIIDAVMTNEQLDFLSCSFQHYPISIVLIYSPLVENLKKCFIRNDLSLEKDLLDYKCPYRLVKKYCTFYRFINLKDTEEPLEVINKQEIKCFLPQIIEQTIKHKCHFLQRDEKVTKKSFMLTIQNTIDEAVEIMKLDNNTEVGAFPAVRNDMIININEVQNLLLLDENLHLLGSEALDSFLSPYFG